MKKVLPMYPPMITVYNHHSHLLSILGNNETAKMWLINNYIDIFIYNDYSWGDFCFNNSEEKLRILPVEICEWIELQRIERKNINNIIDILIDSISQDKYFNVVIDYYYVYGNSSYNKNHHFHDILVNGVDFNKKSFSTYSFWDGKYEQKDITWDEMHEAYSSCNIIEFSDYFEGICFYYKLKNDIDYNYDIMKLFDDIQVYINSKKPSYLRNKKISENDFTFGRNIYKVLAQYCQDNINNKITVDIDIRLFYLIYAHKKIMTYRFKELINTSNYSDYNKIEIFEDIENKALVLARLILKYNLKKDIYILQSAIDLIEQINSIEYQLLSGIKFIL